MAGGPDTSIVVCNFGTHSVRIGFAGDAVPFYDEPSTVWAAPEAPGGPAAGGSRKRPRPTTGRRIFFAAGAAPAGCEVTSPVKAGLVSDWDAAWAHIERALSRADGEAAPPSAAAQAALAAPSSSLPSSSTSSSCPGGGSGGSLRRSALQGRRLLVVDNLLAPRAAREAWAEEALAWRGAAGISFIREPVAICFAHGFVSGLVIDIGASGCRVTPVEAGYPLVMAHRQSTVAGDFMDLATSVITRSSVGKASTCPVDPASLLATDASARALLDSARSLREATADCCQPLLAGDGTFDLAKPPLVPKPVVVGPHRLSGEARARLGDVLFREDAPDTPASTAADESSSEFPALPPGAATIPMMVAASLFACEESARRACGEAVLLTGGVSRTGHCADRLSWELAQPDALAAGLAVHLLPVPLSEVTHSPWMGGSIIASAGTLPDLFISAKEWDSGDASKLLARCI
ncbi:hypothetical protein FNF28_04127 [Cafeteria roenbergensis]|uniref:Actin-related protein 8 n=1 Tax=Cafeteria roenbergensis TaxID=33653 RepID=A0A5A8DGH7_CAFRO|nr:hypothetical protein FNF28_04127 [Cafeteria roenbergensis]